MRTPLLYLFLVYSLSCWSQSVDRISFSHLTVNEGLSQNSVVHIAQDSLGFMWFATQDGLNRFDGRSFKTYPLQFEDITADRFSLLGSVSLSENLTYALTKGGKLFKLDQTTDRFIPVAAPQQLSALYQDKNKTLWLGTSSGELFFKKGEEFVAISLAETKFVSRIKEVDGTLVVAADNKLYSIDKTNSEAQVHMEIDVDDAIINDVELDNKGQLWLGTFTNGVYIARRGQAPKPLTNLYPDFELPNTMKLERLMADKNDRIWLATYGDGVYLLDLPQHSLKHFTPLTYDPSSLNYSDVISLFQDHTGIVWLGTDGGGLNFYDKDLAKFDGIVQSEVPSFANVDVCRAIAVDSQERIWIGTSGKGLTAYHPKQKKYKGFKATGALRALPSDRVMSLLATDDLLFIGFQDAGLASLDLNQIDRGFTWLSDPENPKLEIGTVWSIARNGNNKELWLATRANGLLLIDYQGKLIRQYQHDPNDPKSIPENNIRALHQLPNGDLWVGTENKGVALYDAANQYFQTYLGKGFANVKSVLQQGDKLWIGTNGKGLFKLNLRSQEISQYNTTDGLPNNVVYGILEDPSGKLWLSSNRGITKLTQTDSTAVEFENYTIFDGLQSLEFNTGAYLMDRETQTLYFGGLQGVNWFNPQQIRKNSVPPRTAITKIELHHQEISVKQDMKFKSGDNSFTFHFASLHFAQPIKNEFKYRLANYDQNWSAATTNNLINYTNLPKGTYNFQVISGNYDGIWNTEPSVFEFTILPAWYDSNLAKLCYVIFGLLLILSTYRYFKWRWEMQHKLDIEHREAERLKELDQLKTRLYTNVAHEFRTPLSLISGPIKQLLKTNSDKPEQRELLEIVDNNSQRVVSLANELLELSRLKDGAVRLNIKPHDLDAHLQDLIMPFKGHSGRLHVSLEHELDHFGIQAYDAEVLSKIILNLLSNAFKYAKDHSQIKLKACKLEGLLRFKIENESDTINSENISRLFDRHYREHENAPGSGIGLSLLKELVELTKGKVQAKKQDNNVVSFLVEIPLAPVLDEKDTTPKQSSLIQTTALNNENPLILIAEDDSELLNYTTSLFERQGYQTLMASNGQKAIELCVEKIPDLVISDIRMPVKDGLQLLHEIKSNEKTNHIPVFLLTAQAGTKDQLAGLELQADAYITKPFDPQLLIQQVRNELTAIARLRDKFQAVGRITQKHLGTNNSQELFLDRLRSILKQQLTQPDFNAAKLADELGMSRMQLHRKLKAVTGVAAQELLLNERLALANDLLESSDLNISEIAYSSGFNTPSYFSRCFKEKYGKTPAEYRKK